MHFLTKLGFSPRSNDTYEVGRIIILGCAIFLLIKKLEQTFHGSKMNTVAKNFKCCSSLYSFSDGKTIKNFFCSGASKVFWSKFENRCKFNLLDLEPNTQKSIMTVSFLSLNITFCRQTHSRWFQEWNNKYSKTLVC